jgi:hypothetical protein
VPLDYRGVKLLSLGFINQGACTLVDDHDHDDG